MRLEEFVTEEERLDELLPLITGAASAIGGAGKLAGGVATGVGAAAKGIGQGVGAAAKGVGKAVGTTAQAAADRLKKDDDPEIDQAKDNMLRPGNKLKLPTKTAGGPSEFKVTRVQGNDVEIENPDAVKNSQEPKKVVYKKDDLKKSMQV